MLGEEGGYVSPHMLVNLLRDRIAKANQQEHSNTSNEGINRSSSASHNPLELAADTVDYHTVAWPFRSQTTSLMQQTANDDIPFHTLKRAGLNASRQTASQRNISTAPRGTFEERINIIPVAVCNNNNKPNLFTPHRHGNTSSTHSILRQPDSNTLTTATIPNCSNAGDIIYPHVYVHNTTPLDQVEGIASPVTHSTIDNMESHHDVLNNMTGSGRMKVKPVGNDYFMLTVEDTGVSPQQLEQQMRDRAMRYPSTAATQQRQWESADNRLPEQHHLPNQVSNNMPGQPFMVTWSENGLPRINMLSTPWLSNTLSRQRESSAPPASYTAYSVSEPHPVIYDRSADVKVPVFRIVPNEPITSEGRNTPPTPPPRLKSRRNVVSTAPVIEQSSWSQTLPVNSKPIEHQWNTMDSKRVGAPGFRINAPAAIDVRQVPAAGMPQAPPTLVSFNQSRDLPATPVNNNSVMMSSLTLPPRNRRDLASPTSQSGVDNPAGYVTVKRVDRDADEIPTFKISSSTSPVPRFNETLPRPTVTPTRLENSDEPPSQKSPSGYLQKYLRDVRSPSPARKSLERERSRQRTPRVSTRNRSRERQMRSPSPMPEKRRDIVFNEEIDWSNTESSSKVDWDQISAVVSCGQDVQRLSVVTSLPHLLKDNRDECLRRVIPKIKEFLPIAQADMQLAASTVFLQIFQSAIVPSSVYSQHFLPIVLTALDSKDADVGEAWLETLLEVIPLLSKDVLRREVMTKAMHKGQLSQNIQSRLMSCRILGRISVCLESFVIKKEILPLVQSLCQDVEYDVRACMCRQLDLVAKGLGLESTKGAILPELVELANDEESSVRLAGLDAVVSILCLLDDETCSNTIIPLVVKFCQGALQEQDSTLPVVSKHLGKLCHGLSPNMTTAQKNSFLDYFKKLCSLGRSSGAVSSDVNDNLSAKPSSVGVYDDDRPIECRVNAAFNFPAMALFAGSPSKFDQELSDSFSHLCRDPSIAVRKTMAHGFHEVSKCMGSHVSLLLKDLIVLFKDDYCQVLKGLVANLPDSVSSFSKVINPDKVTHSIELLTALLSCEQVIFSSNDWRLQEQLVDSLSSLTKLFSSDLIYQRLVPRMFDKLHTAKFLPVRLAAVKTLLQYLRCNKKLEQRKAICHRIISEFGQGKSFRDRTLFIDICQQVFVVFSRAFFKDNFYENILELSADPVPNIRLRLCQVMPSLKLTIKLPTDRNLLQQLESHVRKLLINERDRDVLAQLKVTVDELDRINCIHDTIHSRRNLTDEDLADQQKEEEERLLIELEEKEREDEVDQTPATGSSSSTKKKGGEKKSSNVLTASTKTASKASLDRKQPGSSAAKASKIPTVPGGKEPRRQSQHSTKPGSTIPTANGTASGPVRSAGSSTGRGAKSTSSSRNIASPGSSTNVSSAGSTRNPGRSPGGMGAQLVGSPVNSASRRRIDTNHENQKLDNIPGLTSLRRASRESVQRKPSH